MPFVTSTDAVCWKHRSRFTQKTSSQVRLRKRPLPRPSRRLVLRVFEPIYRNHYIVWKGCCKIANNWIRLVISAKYVHWFVWKTSLATITPFTLYPDWIAPNIVWSWVYFIFNWKDPQSKPYLFCRTSGFRASWMPWMLRDPDPCLTIGFDPRMPRPSADAFGTRGDHAPNGSLPSSGSRNARRPTGQACSPLWWVPRLAGGASSDGAWAVEVLQLDRKGFLR